MCRSRLWLLYCVRTATCRTPALTRFDSAKSINRYSPANGTAGLARSAVSGASRLPSPPARTMPITLGSAMSFLHIVGGGVAVTYVTRTSVVGQPPLGRVVPDKAAFRVPPRTDRGHRHAAAAVVEARDGRTVERTRRRARLRPRREQIDGEAVPHREPARPDTPSTAPTGADRDRGIMTLPHAR